MISFIRGTLVEKTPTYSVIETGGIGFRVFTPLSTFEKLGAAGAETALQTILYLREETVTLYGFATSEEKELFRHLISVSGIGPKIALGVLSGIPAAEFRAAILHQDVTRLTKVPGIGKKTAERMMLELREKVVSEEANAGLKSRFRPEIEEPSITALVSLGYKRFRAQEIIREILRESPGLSIEETIRKALQKM